jgi:hypothetical protein
MQSKDPHYLKYRETYLATARRHREQNRELYRNYTRRQQGNIEPELVPALLELQQHRCAICLKDLSQAPGRDVCADHAHGSGRMRGMLCRRCNAGLGHFKDDPLRLRLAVEYLRSPPRERLP